MHSRTYYHHSYIHTIHRIESVAPSSEGEGTVTKKYVLVLRVLLCRPVYPFRDRYILLIMSVTHIMYPPLHNAVSHRLSSHDIHHSFHSPHIPLTIHSHSHVCSHPFILYKLLQTSAHLSSLAELLSHTTPPLSIPLAKFIVGAVCTRLIDGTKSD